MLPVSLRDRVVELNQSPLQSSHGIGHSDVDDFLTKVEGLSGDVRSRYCNDIDTGEVDAGILVSVAPSKPRAKGIFQ